MVKIYDARDDRYLGSVSDEQFQFLVDQLEEESAEDQDYYLNTQTVDGFQEAGADPALLDLLRGALSGREEADIRWVRE